MKPIYLKPNQTLMFVPMKEEPHAGIRKSPFVKSSLEDGHGKELKPPFHPGEKYYVREVWKHIGNQCHPGTAIQACVIYTDGGKRLCGSWPDFSSAPDRRWWNSGKVVWFSPVTMPQWAARRFVTVISCTPMRVEDVTEEDCIAVGFTDTESAQFGPAGGPSENMGARVDFYEYWKARHPGKEWAWRVEAKEAER